ncbi:isocitrate lyase/phosphoenolpyruvate mutase family protein [Hyphomicrobium sp. CS1BSMeth3]|uniref:isocitrate lyase/PEP mutase family protein n=1 Tax=Hyphomicrobium sp. CS1BSMeth3 TaxID=1892844 RepID=UPI000931C04E|nr:isocitrate lyase/phosphoenolpyruvate mutase family protein [Hyphomicrobium sp. CS1BSMeth3]
MTLTVEEKSRRFVALHERDGTFVIPNPWDAGSARILSALGFEALATSSGAAAGVLGRTDGRISRDEAIAHARIIVEATDLPVAADLESGFGDSVDDAAATIRAAGAVGLVGGSIEDCAGPGKQIYEFDHAVRRVEAAIAAARALPFRFMFTARAENFIRGNPDLDDTIRRLKAYEQAGADVLFAPGLPDIEAVRKVCASLDRPFNFMVGIKGRSFTVADLTAAGVKRISLAGSLHRAAMTGLIDAAREVRDQGTFGYLDRSVPGPDLNKMLDG